MKLEEAELKREFAGLGMYMYVCFQLIYMYIYDNQLLHVLYGYILKNDFTVKTSHHVRDFYTFVLITETTISSK